MWACNPSPDCRTSFKVCTRGPLNSLLQSVTASSRPIPDDRASTGLYNAPAEVLKDECFRPEWADDWRDVTPLIHARAETVALKPFFRQAFRTKRCLVLADGFYEWQRTGKGKVPYRITLKTDEPFAFAGIWSLVHDAQRRPWSTFAIITTAANRPVAPIHHRMPVILHPQDEATWLNQETSPARAQACLKPFPAHLLRISVGVTQGELARL